MIRRVARVTLRSLARTLFIQVRETPNPRSLMFLPGTKVLGDENLGFMEFDSFVSSQKSPLAKQIFAVGNVERVMYGADFVSVTIKEGSEWHIVRPFIFSAISDFITSGEDLIAEHQPSEAEDSLYIRDDDDEIVASLKELIDTRIRPAVREDGGDIIYRGFNHETGIVSLQLAGSCVGCSSSIVTLKMGVEKMLMHYLPEVKGIEDLTDHSH